MIVNVSEVLKGKEKPLEVYPFDKLFPASVSFSDQKSRILKETIGEIIPGSVINFWTSGRISMHDILNYVLRQTGPCSVSACTWAISEDAVTDILNRIKDGLITDFRLWIDPRVKVRNPIPLQMATANFPVCISPVHAKVCVLENASWKISISGSLNFTSNPQPERGVIQCIDSVYLIDKKLIYEEFDKRN